MGYADMEQEKSDLERQNFLAQQQIEQEYGGTVMSWALAHGATAQPPELQDLKAAAARIHAELDAREAAHREELEKLASAHREEVRALTERPADVMRLPFGP